MLYHPLTPRSNSVRDELTSSADDNEDTPESLISLSMEYEKQNNLKWIFKISVSEVRDELTFSDSDNEHAPESPILFLFIKNEKCLNEIVENYHTPKFNSVRDEFTSNAFDNENVPDEPILFIKNGKCTNETKRNHSNLNSFSNLMK